MADSHHPALGSPTKSAEIPAAAPLFTMVARAVQALSHRTNGNVVVVVVNPFLPRAVGLEEDWRRSFGLSKRECQVAELLAVGRSPKEIGGVLSISTHTARRHTERVYAKLGVHDRVSLALMLHRAQERTRPSRDGIRA
jgi:DNA-binding CsgD family transcriptional regulator